ncbi:TetR/AcrR family transcriptional regulator [Nocardioides terrisoli]|uniref:TetR/AcrR family transcriptional regulator n=1 Tax=Nocardioides terrisoli TaxID=3388267 RepID=UPI00287B99E9|nr:TetR/AcrR family transcriptional regulator [Nocardioides marmorisolisilvae]
MKPLRADAQRNRDKLIETAREAFRERGSAASLDDIAKRAGVGPGTLYRHFPTRDDLIDAVMRDWADRVEADAQTVIDAGRPPRETLTTWFTRFLDNVGIYHGAATKVMSAMDDPASPIYRKCQVLAEANRRVLESDAVRSGVREGVDPRQVMRLVSGISVAVDQAGLAPEQAEPMLRIVLDGVLRPDAD